jgi:hypothetical protein
MATWSCSVRACRRSHRRNVTTQLDEIIAQAHAAEKPDDETEQTKTLTVLEVDERPASVVDEKPLFRRLSKTDCLNYAAELAADMETGLYTPEGSDVPWEPGHRFVIRDILRAMGYSPSYIRASQRPVWWPPGGTAAFRDYVEWKKRERQMVGRITYDKLTPYIEALTYKGFAEMARRIMLNPDSVKFRDLAQFTMRGVEFIKGQADPWTTPISEDGADAYARMAKAIDGVGDATARKAIEALLDATLVAARARMRKVVEIPAKAS